MNISILSKSIGNTPLIKLEKYSKELGINLFAKVEKGNLSGSSKDRAAYKMIIDLINSGKIKKGDTIIEETSGNTGISLACLSNYFGLNCIIVMPSSASIERRELINKYNAKLVLVDGGMQECVKKAKEINENIPGSVIIGQFDNYSNVLAHYETTGPEIYKDLKDVDVVIIGIGTGGTITGIGKYLKEVNKNIEIIGIEPASSPLITKGYACSHGIEGIGANFIPSILDLKYVNKVLTVTDEDAIKYAKEVNEKEGLFVGKSSGAVLACAVELSKLNEYKNKNIVILFPDGGERYSWN